MDVTDERTIVDFQKFTFSGHLRNSVYKVLDENIRLGHKDYACYWSLELLCSGITQSLWQVILESAASHVNRASPNVFLYLLKMYEKFAPYENSVPVLQITSLRNNNDVRNLICETVSTVAGCRKNKLPLFPRMKVDHDFKQETIAENVKSPSANYARHISKPEDPMELYIPLNELVYCLKPETRDSVRAFYWVSWILAFASHYKKQNKQQLVCAQRHNKYIEDKHERHVIWLIWNAVLDAASSSPQSALLAPYIDAIYKFNCLRWTSKTKLCFLATSIVFICESASLDVHTPVNSTHSIVENIPQWISAIIQTKRTFS
jgi:hypothetical protein